jgi:hypothetical protein
MPPNVRGLISTTDGASIPFELRGRTIFEGDEPERQTLVGWLESEAEGRIGAGGLEIHLYAGIHDMPA